MIFGIEHMNRMVVMVIKDVENGMLQKHLLHGIGLHENYIEIGTIIIQVIVVIVPVISGVIVVKVFVKIILVQVVLREVNNLICSKDLIEKLIELILDIKGLMIMVFS